MVAATQPREAGKQKGVLKKVIKYLQDQATENSNPRLYLSPPGRESHQKFTSPRTSQQDYIRRLSDATTAVDRRPGPMAGDGTDVAVQHEAVSSPAKEMKKVQYAHDNILQNYRIHIPDRDQGVPQGHQYWIIYIHGGYFRDPKVDALSFRHALEILTSDEPASNQNSALATVPESVSASPATSRTSLSENNELIQRHIAGYASINYRLAPHPAYPQNDATEKYVRRNAVFPQQLDDVFAAIRHLQTRHDFTNNYILAGHSVGATLSFLAALKAVDGQIDPPACVLGLNGIYDFPAIHKTHPEYEMMTSNTMRPDQYEIASPALYPQSDFSKILPKQTFRVLLSHSRDDGLVDWDQAIEMQKTLQHNSDDHSLRVEFLETRGQHDAIWKGGKELARSLTTALKMLTDY